MDCDIFVKTLRLWCRSVAPAPAVIRARKCRGRGREQTRSHHTSDRPLVGARIFSINSRYLLLRINKYHLSLALYKILLFHILEHEIPTKVILKLVKFEVEGLLKIDVFINAVVDNLTLKLYIVI